MNVGHEKKIPKITSIIKYTKTTPHERKHHGYKT